MRDVVKICDLCVILSSCEVEGRVNSDKLIVHFIKLSSFTSNGQILFI